MSKFSQGRRRGSVVLEATLPPVTFTQDSPYPTADFVLSWGYPLPETQTVTAYLEFWDGDSWEQHTSDVAGLDATHIHLTSADFLPIGTRMRVFYGFEGTPYSGNAYTGELLLE